MTKKELDDRLAVARLVPGMAHLPSFGLVLQPGQQGPICRHCGGRGAPIVDGEHLSEDWCARERARKGEL